ncbi:MAG TPA: hypothetical protein VN192_06085 [Flavobacterium sp.]|jgi:hypothetical protein|nr:hypothetical protein [Flavobacterium sp.]
MKTKFLFYILITSIIFSCSSSKSSVKNIDNTAPTLTLSDKNTFVITEYSKDKKYGYTSDYPINIYYKTVKNDSINQIRYLNALAGPKGEPLSYRKIETCCPFPTKNSSMGAGFLDVYEIRWKDQKTPIKLYFNIYEKGIVLVPVGLTLKR